MFFLNMSIFLQANVADGHSTRVRRSGNPPPMAGKPSPDFRYRGAADRSCSCRAGAVGAAGVWSPLRLLDAWYAGYVAVRLAADIVLDPQLVMLIVDEARLPIFGVVVGIVDGDDVLELGRAHLADALDGAQLVGVGRAGRV